MPQQTLLRIQQAERPYGHFCQAFQADRGAQHYTVTLQKEDILVVLRCPAFEDNRLWFSSRKNQAEPSIPFGCTHQGLESSILHEVIVQVTVGKHSIHLDTAIEKQSEKPDLSAPCLLLPRLNALCTNLALMKDLCTQNLWQLFPPHRQNNSVYHPQLLLRKAPSTFSRNHDAWHNS